jgi:hypothetical protein
MVHFQYRSYGGVEDNGKLVIPLMLLRTGFTETASTQVELSELKLHTIEGSKPLAAWMVHEAV